MLYTTIDGYLSASCGLGISGFSMLLIIECKINSIFEAFLGTRNKMFSVTMILTTK
jgi:hypothetical protein